MANFSAFTRAGGLLVLHFLCACGGGAGTQTDLQEKISSDNLLKGVVVDDYLVGAKVCLDVNSNWLCEPGEPYTFSTKEGKYVLDVSPLKYWDTYDKLVLAEVNDNVIDEVSGKTLKEKNESGYKLAASGGPKPILSPMNTLGVARYFQNGLKDIGATYILTDIAKSNGLSTSSEDYVDLNTPLSLVDRELAKKSGKVIANALAKAQLKLISNFPDQYAVSSPKLGARSAQIVVQALGDSVSSSDTESASDMTARINHQIDSLALSADYERLLQTPVVLLNPSEALNVLNEGVFDVSLLGSMPRSLLAFQSQSNAGALKVNNYIYRGNQWAKDSTFQSHGSAGFHILIKYFDWGSVYSELKTTAIGIPSSIWVTDNHVLIEKFSADSHAPIREIRIIARPLEGLPFSAVPGLTALQGRFTAGQKIYQIQRKTLGEEYVFDEVSTFFNSLTAFLASPRTCYAGICWSISQSVSENNTSGEGVMTFSTTSNAGSLNLGEAPFDLGVIAGIRYLKMKSIPMAVQNRSAFWSAKEGRMPLFADFENKLWIGHYSPGSIYWNSAWMMSMADLNIVLANAALSLYIP